MKMKFKRISKSTLSVILAMMMLVSTMLIGTMSATAADSITVYFKNTVGWNSVYLYLFNSSPWQDSNGVNPSGKVIDCIKMDEVSGQNNVYSCTYSGNYNKWVAFAEKGDQRDYGQFNNNKASYRADFTNAVNNSTTMFTPDSTPTNPGLNNTDYYNNGEWSTYSDDIDHSNVTYRLNGASTITGKSSNVENYDDSADFTTVNGTTYETTITYTHDSKNNFFSIVGSDGRYYDPANTDSVNATNGCSNVEVFPNTTKSGRNFYFTESGTYKITLDASGTNPKVTVEKASSWFVHGNFIDANNQYKDYNFVNNSVSIPLLASKTYRFKIANGTTYYGNNGQMSSNCSVGSFLLRLMNVL